MNEKNRNLKKLNKRKKLVQKMTNSKNIDRDEGCSTASSLSEIYRNVLEVS